MNQGHFPNLGSLCSECVHSHDLLYVAWVSDTQDLALGCSYGKALSMLVGTQVSKRWTLFLNLPSVLANISCPHSGSFSLVPTASPGTALTTPPFPNVLGISGVNSVPAP